MVTILILAVMLPLGTAISLGSVNPVLPAFALFVALFLAFLGICVLPGYARIRARVLDRRFSPGAHRPAKSPLLSARLPASR
jgi:hypothetical protein